MVIRGQNRFGYTDDMARPDQPCSDLRHPKQDGLLSGEPHA